MTAASGHLPLPVQHTRRYEFLTDSDIKHDAHILFAANTIESRAQLPLWASLRTGSPERCVVVEAQEHEHEHIRADARGNVRNVALRDEADLGDLLNCGTLYLDISGLSHHVWAPILKIALSKVAALYVVYVEPEHYKPHPSPASPSVFDLSREFKGLAPLPGFARLSGPADEEKTLLVAFLGFEGNRPLHLALQLDPVPTVIPVIGVPGFRIQYPAFSFACNREFLEEYQAHGEIRLARASCPFEAYQTLRDLVQDYPDHYVYIAPVGTKPHSLGAVHFAIENPETTEILYDHPVRKSGRTTGVGIVNVYDMRH